MICTPYLHLQVRDNCAITNKKSKATLNLCTSTTGLVTIPTAFFDETGYNTVWICTPNRKGLLVRRDKGVSYYSNTQAEHGEALSGQAACNETCLGHERSCAFLRID